MLRLLMFIHHIALCTSYIATFNVGHLFAYVIDPTEQELEQQVQTENTNPNPKQGKPRCI
jgi:hypothetical protein